MYLHVHSLYVKYIQWFKGWMAGEKTAVIEKKLYSALSTLYFQKSLGRWSILSYIGCPWLSSPWLYILLLFKWSFPLLSLSCSYLPALTSKASILQSPPIRLNTPLARASSIQCQRYVSNHFSCLYVIHLTQTETKKIYLAWQKYHAYH